MGASKKMGAQTVRFEKPPVLVGSATVAGPKEGNGPLGTTFDRVLKDNYDGEKTWEKTERKMLEEAIRVALQKSAMTIDQVDIMLSGDLLNQIISANFVAQKLGIPFLGLFGACSTLFEGMAVGSMLIDGGFAQTVVVGTSSHYGTAERQYRLPTEQGSQRTMTAQWTVTGAGGAVLREDGVGLRVTHATIGKVIDMGLKDAQDMGSAMAPAASDTLIRHLKDTGRSVVDYDLIITGDLGKVGRELMVQLAKQAGYDLSRNYDDGGVLIFNENQDVHAGGSGCACSALVICGHIMQQMRAGKYQRVLGIGTGALLSSVSLQQGENIPCIGHAVVLER